MRGPSSCQADNETLRGCLRRLRARTTDVCGDGVVDDGEKRAADRSEDYGSKPQQRKPNAEVTHGAHVAHRAHGAPLVRAHAAAGHTAAGHLAAGHTAAG